MKFFAEFLKDRVYPILWGCAVVLICWLIFWLHNVPFDSLIYSVLLCFAVGVFLLTFDFIREYRRHRARLRSIRSASYERTDLIDEYGVAATDYSDLVQALWKRIEDTHLKPLSGAKIDYALYDGKFVRSISAPDRDCTTDELAAALSEYIKLFDKLMKAYLAGRLDEHDVEAAYFSQMRDSTVHI